jgi:Helix-turn-helix domain
MKSLKRDRAQSRRDLDLVPGDALPAIRQHVGVDQAEQLTGLSRWSWRRMAYDGRITSTKVGTRLLIPVDEIQRVLAEGTRPRAVEVA